MPDSHDPPLDRPTPGMRIRARVLPGQKPAVEDANGEIDDLYSSPDVLPKERNEGDTVERGLGGRRSNRGASQLPPLPRRKTKTSRGLLLSFCLCVALPTALSGIYYYIFAADQYVAEFKFSVMEASPVLPGLPPSLTTTSPTAATGGSPMMALMGSSGSPVMGGSMAPIQNFMVTDYLLSSQVVGELQKRLDVRALYDSPVAKYDVWARFDRSLPMERFMRYWPRMVTATYDPMTGVADVLVRAFTPQDALAIANTMVSLSEDLVNKVAQRPQQDAVRFAEGELTRAKERVKRARAALTEYRLQEGVIDPSGVVSTNIALVQTLRAQLSQQQADLATFVSQQQNANSPAAQQMRSRVAGTKDQVAKLEKEISKDREGNRILTELVDRYERIDLERQYAQGMLVSAEQALDQARANAAAQHLYLTPYVRPSLPEYPIYPKKIQGVLIAAIAFFGLWLVGVMIHRSVSEHASY